MSATEFVLVYSTFPDSSSAEAVARALVERKLAACVNIHGPMTSVYEWEGSVTADLEFAAFIKTRAALADEAIAAARRLHPYSVPCFLKLPIAGGNPDYFAWLKEQTAR